MFDLAGTLTECLLRRGVRLWKVMKYSVCMWLGL